MSPKNLDHLRSRVEEIKAVSGKVGGQLRYIREDLSPLIEMGLPLGYILSLLADLGITQRRATLREFVKKEFPESYIRYYAQKATAEKVRREIKETPPVRLPETVRTVSESFADGAPEERHHETQDGEPSPTKVTPETPRRRTAARLSVNSLTSQFGAVAEGKHFTDEHEGDS